MKDQARLSEGFGRWVMFMEVSFRELQAAENFRLQSFERALHSHRTPLSSGRFVYGQV